MSESRSKVFNKIFSKPFILKFIKFAIVGAIGTVVNLSILYLFTEIFNIYYLISEVFAFLISLLSNYVLNKIWTFKEDLKKDVVRKYLKYAVISLISLIVNMTILFVLVENFEIWYIFAEIIAIGGAFLVNFIGSVLWTFRTKIEQIEEQD